MVACRGDGQLHKLGTDGALYPLADRTSAQIASVRGDLGEDAHRVRLCEAASTYSPRIIDL